MFSFLPGTVLCQPIIVTPIISHLLLTLPLCDTATAPREGEIGTNVILTAV